MRSALWVAWCLLLTCGEAGAQSCNTGCGCQPDKSGSGWRRLDTKKSKCLGCDQMHLCIKDGIHCKWEGCRNLALIREHCPQHIPAVPCPMK
jgi:hypothetical protein